VPPHERPCSPGSRPLSSAWVDCVGMGPVSARLGLPAPMTDAIAAQLLHTRTGLATDGHPHLVGDGEREAVTTLADLLEAHSSVDVTRRSQRPPAQEDRGSFAGGANRI
jgi:hypothetical protein